jgi:Transposase IS116/IS110/IS902 family
VLEQVTAELLAGHDGYRAVQELPGIGPVLGAVIVAEIGDVTRLRHPARLCSRAGLTPRHYESDTTVIRGRITQQGSPVLRWALARGRPADPGRHPDPPGQRRHHRPPRHPGAQHRQGPPRPASCSPTSSTRCATGTPDPWPPVLRSMRPGEQARLRAARDRFRVWPPPRAAWPPHLIDPAARADQPHAPRPRAAGHPEG